MDDEDYFPPGTPTREISIRRRVRRLAEFYQHLLVFVGVNSLLWMINAVMVYQSTKDIKWTSWWALWPLLGWGIGLVTHAITVMPVWGFFTTEWEERKVKELMERESK